MNGRTVDLVPIQARVDARVEADSASSGARLAELFDAHEDRLYRLARRLTSSRDDAHDLVQETFLRAARSLRSVPAGASREEAWLVRVLVNIRRDDWRKSGVRTRAAGALRAGLAGGSSSVESALMIKRAVWGALDALPPRRRAVVVMHELEGLSIQSIATSLGISRVTTSWHLSMARRELKRILAVYLGDRK